MGIRHTEVAFEVDPSVWRGREDVSARSHEFLRGLIGGIRCGVLAIDREGRLVLINRQGCEILGLERAPEPGAPAVVALGDHPRLLRLLGDAFSLSHLPNRAELGLGPGRRDGITIGFTLSHVPGADGQTVGAALFFKDLTRIEQSEEQERLKDRLAALGQMAARLAHEVRNPLASIEVTCGLLRRRFKKDASGQELLDKITAEVKRLDRTVTSSLEFVRPVAANMTVGELPRVLERAVTVALRRRGRSGVQIALRADEAFPAFRMDSERLQQVFENLLLNALEAVGDPGQVTVEAERTAAPTSATVPYGPKDRPRPDPWADSDGLAVVRVSDDGPGIPDDQCDRIFHPFFTTKSQGSGVGLSTVRKIVDSHGGLIDVDRSPQGGARFTVRLPMVFERSKD